MCLYLRKKSLKKILLISSREQMINFFYIDYHQTDPEKRKFSDGVS